MNMIDLSLLIDNNCMTCGTPWHEKVKIEKLGALETVGRNTSRFLLGSHSATHMDAPLHFIEGEHGIDGIDPERCWGPVTCVDLHRKKCGSIVGLDDVKSLEVTERMLFVFGWWRYWKTPHYYERFPFFSTEAIRYLVESGMKFMALDTPSPDDGSGIQKIVLGNIFIQLFPVSSGIFYKPLYKPFLYTTIHHPISFIITRAGAPSAPAILRGNAAISYFFEKSI